MTNETLITSKRLTRTKELLLETAEQLLDISQEINRKEMASKILLQYEDLNHAIRDCDNRLFKEVTVPVRSECEGNARNTSN